MREGFAVNGIALVMVLGLVFSAKVMAEDVKAPVKVFLLGGQSNMVGSDKSSKLPAVYQVALPSVTIWHHATGTWLPLAPEAVNRRGRFGPEVTFGHTVAATYPSDSIRLIKYASSGTALYNDWSPAEQGQQYRTFMERAQAAIADLKASGVNFELAGMLWLQGESDAQEGKGDVYEKNLSDFITHMRKAFEAPDMPFVIARVRDHYGRKNGHAKLVRDAQVALSESMQNVAWFDTDDCAMLNAGHYNAEGLADIGKRFAATSAEMIGSK